MPEEAKSSVREEVEAALLNSSGHPEREVLAALAGVANFAVQELGASDEALHRALDVAIREVRAELREEIDVAPIFEQIVAAEAGEFLGVVRSSPPVDGFQGKHRFLSNFTDVLVKYEDVEYPSVEAAYQAAKCADPKQRAKFAMLVAADAKKLGKRVKVRPDWEDVKLTIMADLVRQKFQQEPYRTQLLATGDAELVEVNHWGDAFWGVYRGAGENHLGRILMAVRHELGGSR